MRQTNNYNGKIDSWALGLILHELYTGNRPYRRAYDLDEQLKNIRKAPVKFDSEAWEDFSIEAIDLVENILQFESSKRLSVA